MVFSSILFLCLFMPVVFGLYYLCPAKCRNSILLISSLIFYAWGEPRYILIMIFSTVFDYTNGRLIEYYRAKNSIKMQKAVLVVSVVGNLGILCFFKYTDFLIKSINGLFDTQFSILGIALPIGISFYTFQTMSYTIDVYKGRVEAQHNILDFGMYVCMFPQLIAGPIVRYEHVSKEIHNRKLSSEDIASGIQLFIIGLGKKVILANQIGALWDSISAMNTSKLSVAGAWLGAVAYTFQIYFDFSGYSDMAIGMGKMLGFNFPKNFDYPYISKSITEFWRRWHITLGQWFREYVYIPLGGNRRGLERQIFNLLIVWALTGLWHGAGWNFVIWGLYFFVILMIEKLFLLEKFEKLPKVFSHIYALVLIVVGWVIFACDDFGKLENYLKALIGVGVPIINDMAVYDLYTHIPLLIILIAASTMLPVKLCKIIKEKLMCKYNVLAGGIGEQLFFWCKGIYCIIILLISIALLVSGTYNPFLYFRF